MYGWSRRASHMRRTFVSAGCLMLSLAMLGATLTSCGRDMTNSREAFLEFRSRYENGNYEGMLEMLHSSARTQLERADSGGNARDALRRQLPPRGELERLVDDVLQAHPEAMDDLDRDKRRQLFYRILVARQVVQGKSTRELSSPEQELRSLDLRYALAFTVPRDELGPRMNPQQDSIEFNLGPAGEITFPIQRDSKRHVLFMWPRQSR